MFSNIGGLEVIFVMVIALIVLGPTKLPEAARQVGRVVNEVRRVSSGFQKEFQEAIQEPIIEAEARARGAVESTKIAVTEPFKAMSSDNGSSDAGTKDDAASSTAGGDASGEAPRAAGEASDDGDNTALP